MAALQGKGGAGRRACRMPRGRARHIGRATVK
jgi:hypothetical protein